MGEAGAAVEHPADPAIQMIRRTVELLGPKRCCLSFNGGKDSTVLLHLVREALPSTFRDIHYVYFDQPHEFPEVESFIDVVTKKYAIKIRRPSGSFKQGLAQLLQETDVQCIFLGTRSTDPHGDGLEALCLTTGSWPTCIRAHPILRWDYAEVWAYLRGEDRPYCELYDRGYTSLGSTLDTLPNPVLRNTDGSYRPAFELTDGTLERANRKGGEGGESKFRTLLSTPTAKVFGALGLGLAVGFFVGSKLSENYRLVVTLV